MCGICGIFRPKGGPVDESLLRAMNARMVARGPDDEGFHLGHGIGFGFRRLSIIDLDHAHQPIANEDGSLWLVMNGEIYNYRKLRKDLVARGHKFSTQGDAEVILHLYEEIGERCVELLNGMFAFALYDERRNQLLVVRDRLGIKPLYYAWKNGEFIFSSNLLAIGEVVECKLDNDGFLSYLATAYIPDPLTIFDGVKKLPPGHIMRIGKEGGQPTCYWRLEEIGVRYSDPTEAATELDALLYDSLRLQVHADVPVGVLLSGGVDSSALLAGALDVTQGPISTYTVNYQGKGGMDAEFARQLARKFGTNHRELVIGREDAISYLDEFIVLLDEPLADSAMISTYALSRLANEDGVKVLLNGAGGDELFGGYGRHMAPSVGSMRWLREHFPSWLAQILYPLLARMRSDYPLRLGTKGADLGVSISGVDLGFIARAMRNPEHTKRMLEYLEQRFGSVISDEKKYGYGYSRMLNDVRCYLVDNILALTDKATMAASIEGRVPLLDHRLVEFAFSLVPSINYGDRQPKRLFKQVLAGHLPADLLNRPKEGFNPPMKQWLIGERGGDMEIELCEQLVEPLSEMFEPLMIQKTLTDQKKRGLASESLYTLYLFNRWWRTHYK